MLVFIVLYAIAFAKVALAEGTSDTYFNFKRSSYSIFYNILRKHIDKYPYEYPIVFSSIESKGFSFKGKQKEMLLAACMGCIRDLSDEELFRLPDRTYGFLRLTDHRGRDSPLMDEIYRAGKAFIESKF